MAGLSLRDAAREAGVSKSTISRAIKSGRLSADRNDDGNFAIDASELFRVYPRNGATRPGNGSAGHDATGAGTADETRILEAENEGLRAQLAMLRELADEMKGQRDAWQRQAEASQRLLADQRSEPRRRWFWLRQAG